MPEPVIIKVGADLSDLTAKLESFQSQLDELKGTVRQPGEELKKSFTGATGAINEVKMSAKQLDNEIRAVTESMRKTNDPKATAALKQYKQELLQEEAALNKTKTTTKGLQLELRGLIKEMSALDLAGKRNSAEYDALSQKAGNMRRVIDDAKQTIKALGSDTKYIDGAIQGVQGLIGAFSIFQGVQMLVGSENEDFQKAMLKMMATMQVLNGVQQVANILQKESALMQTVNATVIKINEEILRRQTAALIADTAATNTNTAAKTLSKGVIGLVILAVAALVAITAKLIKDQDKRKAQLIEEKTLSEGQIATLKELHKTRVDAEKQNQTEIVSAKVLFGALKSAAEGTQARKQAIEDVNSQYGKYLPNLLTEKSSVQEIADAYNNVVSAIYLKIQAQASMKAAEIYADEGIALQGNIDLLVNQKDALDKFLVSWNDYVNNPVENPEPVKPAILGTLSASTATLDELNIQITKNNDLLKSNKSRAESAINTAILYTKSVDGLTYSHDKNTKSANKNTKDRLANTEKLNRVGKEVADLTILQLKLEKEYSDNLHLLNKQFDYGYISTSQYEEAVSKLNITYGKTNELFGKLTKIDLSGFMREYEKSISDQGIFFQSFLQEGDTWNRERTNQVIDGTLSMYNQLNDILLKNEAQKNDQLIKGIDDRYAKEKEKLDEDLKNKKLSQEQYDKEAVKLEEQKDRQIAKIKREQWKKEQKAAIAKATINTLVGTTQALAEGGIAGIITGALVLAAGIAEVASISSQKNPYRKGTAQILSGNSHEGGGISLGQFGTAEGGEMLGILSKKNTKRFGKPMLELFDGINKGNDSKMMKGLSGLVISAMPEIRQGNQTVNVPKQPELAKMLQIMEKPQETITIIGNKKIIKKGNYTRIVHL